MRLFDLVCEFLRDHKIRFVVGETSGRIYLFKRGFVMNSLICYNERVLAWKQMGLPIELYPSDPEFFEKLEVLLSEFDRSPSFVREDE